MELEEAIKTLKDFAKYGRYYSNNTEHHMKTAINAVLNQLEQYKRLAEMNLKDSEEFQNNMCEHRCILYNEIEELKTELFEEKEKNNNLIKQLQEQNTEIQDISRQLRQEKEKNKELEKQINLNKKTVEIAQTQILEYSQGYKDGLNKETTATAIVARELEFNFIRQEIKHKYISKDKLKFVLSKLNISDIEPWSTYKIDGKILFDLQELL